MKKIIFATGNEDKMKEIRRILADPSLEILSLKDAGSMRILMKMEKALKKMP